MVAFALIRARAAITDLKGDNHDQTIGVDIARRALEEPIRQIVNNAGDEASVVTNNVEEGEGNYGYNAATGEYGDMIELGILDPTKVARFALQNAASVAGLLITTEAMIAEAPKEAGPAMPDMSGYGWRHGRHGRHDVISPAALASAALGFGSRRSHTKGMLTPSHRIPPCSCVARDARNLLAYR